MKKNVIFLLLAVIFVGCKPKQTIVNTKLDTKSEVAIKGNWKITSVTFPGSDYIKINSFDLADSKCFVGSNWKFISNNNKGEMALNNASCIAFSSPITWYINKEGNLVMKIINDTKAKKVLEGYILVIANLTETSFQLVDKVNVGGQFINVEYQFNKN
ncbi:lipocalin family protein [Flavobacterium sp.]|uniref:lipocalin family protein n=1 Tax=Flavobacterium sp. TaxID=239 RepID=UPI003BD2E79B